ncbi:MAG: histidine phosphatase family protein [Pseudomonadota bacterium]|nr:histidine phosphatase family protein [Pseudomonadota bacterium]
MAAIYLIRHGQASLHSENYDQLSPTGERQAVALGAALKQRGIQFDAVYAGSMRRHAQTAAGCLQAMDCALAPTILDGFNEYDHEEVMARHRPEFSDHLSRSEYLAKHPNPNKAFQIEFELALHRWRMGEYDHEYAETWQHFSQRCTDALDHVRYNSGNAKSIAVFSSGGPISIATGSCLGLTDEHIAELSWSIINCSVTCLLFNSKKMTLRYFNDYSHFEYAEDKSLFTYR